MSSNAEFILGEVAELVRGIAYKPSDLLDGPQDGAVPLLRATNIGARTLELDDVLYVPSRLVKPTQYLRRFDVVIAMSSGSQSAVGRLAQLRSNWFGTFGAFCGALRPLQDKVDPEFLGYVLYSPDFRARIETCASGTAIMNLSREHLLGHRVRLPSRADQRAIAEIIGCLDDRIDLLRQTNTTLEAIAKALFKSWFIDFDPVHAKREGRKPDGIDDATAALFPSEFEESELGLIPKGWSLGDLSRISVLNASSWSSKLKPETVSYVELSTVTCNRFDRLSEINYADAPSSARRRLRKGDTIVGIVRPDNNHFGFIAEHQDNLTGSNAFAVLSPIDDSCQEFLYLAATSPRSIERLASLANGAAYPSVRPETVFSTPCIVPCPKVMQAFHDVASPLMMKCWANQKMGYLLSDLRDTLLPRLISGKLRLNEIEKSLP